MPTLIDSPEVVQYQEHALSEAQPRVHAAHPGFWRTVVQYVKRQSVQASTGMPASSPSTRHPIETPAEWFARAYPTLYMRVW